MDESAQRDRNHGLKLGRGTFRSLWSDCGELVIEITPQMTKEMRRRCYFLTGGRITHYTRNAAKSPCESVR
jgi:hypothetical protein